MLIWSSSFDCSLLNFSNNHVDFIINKNQPSSWRLSCYYGFPERVRRRESWDLLRHLSTLSNLSWFIFGDFNDLLTVDDKFGVVPHPQWLFQGF